MVEANIGLVSFVLGRMHVPSWDYEEAFQDGLIGLLTGVRRFDPERGFKFSTYAVWWIRQEVQRGWERRAGSGVRRGHGEAPLSIEAMSQNADGEDLGDSFLGFLGVDGVEDDAVLRADLDAAIQSAASLCYDERDEMILGAILMRGYGATTSLAAFDDQIGLSSMSRLKRSRKFNLRLVEQMAGY